MKEIEEFKVGMIVSPANENLLGSGNKGSFSNPYTLTEYARLLVDGTWTGGFVNTSYGPVYVDTKFRENESNFESMYHAINDYFYYSTLTSEQNRMLEQFRNREIRYAGSLMAKINQKDCMYCCVGYFMNVASHAISDLFGDYLYFSSYGSENFDREEAARKVNDDIRRGLPLDLSGSFETFMRAYLQLSFSIIQENEVVQRVSNRTWNSSNITWISNPNISGGHAVILQSLVPSTGGKYDIYCYDPQKGENTVYHSCGIIKSFIINN